MARGLNGSLAKSQHVNVLLRGRYSRRRGLQIRPVQHHLYVQKLTMQEVKPNDTVRLIGWIKTVATCSQAKSLALFKY